MQDCVFCKIIAGEIPSQKVYEDDDILIIKDIAPEAKVHLLMLPKKHFANIGEMGDRDAEMLGRALKKVAELSDSLGLENGYRLITNKGEDGCQSVGHLHIHILGGEKLPAHLR